MADKRWHKYVMGDKNDTGDVKWNRWIESFVEGVVTPKTLFGFTSSSSGYACSKN